MKTKDALLLDNQERLDAVNTQREELEKQYSEALQRLKEEKEKLDMGRDKVKKELEEKEEQLRIMRESRTGDKETIESLEIEIMYLKKKLETQQVKERELVKEIAELQSKLDENQLNKLAWIADNLEKEIEGVQPEFERQRSQMMANIYKLLTYIKIPDEIMVRTYVSGLCIPMYIVPIVYLCIGPFLTVKDGKGEEEEEENGSPEPEVVVEVNLGEENEVNNAEEMEEEMEEEGEKDEEAGERL